MNRFCIITNTQKDENFEITNIIRNYLDLHKKEYVLAMNEDVELFRKDGYMCLSEIPEDIECAIVLGGDGTMILSATNLINKDIPIIGVNLGTLGFLTDIEKKNIVFALDALFEDKYRIENRLMLEGSAFSNQEEVHLGYALNDFVITRKGTSGLICVNVYVNDELVNAYQGDGVIISTPTGSTGYNLSAGGPVATPTSKVMVITPICPHTFNNRSIIVSLEDKIRVELGKRSKESDDAVVTLDGRSRIKIQTGDVIEISKANKDTKLVKVEDKSFFDILTTKLGEV